MKLTRYEKARIIGARALQIASGAPLILKMEKKEFIEINYNPIKIAQMEFDKGILPITIKRPMP